MDMSAQHTTAHARVHTVGTRVRNVTSVDFVTSVYYTLCSSGTTIWPERHSSVSLGSPCPECSEASHQHAPRHEVRREHLEIFVRRVSGRYTACFDAPSCHMCGTAHAVRPPDKRRPKTPLTIPQPKRSAVPSPPCAQVESPADMATCGPVATREAYSRQRAPFRPLVPQEDPNKPPSGWGRSAAKRRPLRRERSLLEHALGARHVAHGSSGCGCARERSGTRARSEPDTRRSGASDATLVQPTASVLPLSAATPK